MSAKYVDIEGIGNTEKIEKSLNELKELKSRIKICNNLLDLQCSQIACVGPSDSGQYMAGMYNGMELLLSVLEGRKPQFCDISEVSESGRIEEGIQEGVKQEEEGEKKEVRDRAISGIIKEVNKNG